MARLLVVDDDAHFREIIERIILRSSTYTVHTATTAEEAYAELANSPYDLVLLDLNLHGRKSWDTLKKIRALPFPPPVIVISGEDTTENAEYARALGASDFIPKPIDFGRLKRTVDAALGWRGMLRPSRRAGDIDGYPGGGEDLNILVVAEGETGRELIPDAFSGQGLRAIEANSAGQALETLRKERVDAILIIFREGSGFAAEVCRTIRGDGEGSLRTPILAVTDTASGTILAALKAGVDDYITAPLDPQNLVGKVEAHIRLGREYECRLEQVVALCVKDPLTGSYNFSYFKTRLNEEFNRALRYKRSLSLAILGLDNVKKVQAAVGARAVDRILAEASRVIQGAIRSSDIVAHSGEEEFALILPESTADRIIQKAGAIRSRVEESVACVDGRKTEITCSIGLASHPLVHPGGNAVEPIKSAEDLLGMASTALTRARGMGKDRVAVFGF